MRILKRRSEDKPKAIERLDFERPFLSLREAINRLFDESFWDPFSLVDAELSPVSGLSFFPKADIAETDKEVIITADVPGIDAEKIDIEVDEDSVTLSGKVEKESEQKDKRYYRFERQYGEFRRSFNLPAIVKADEAVAKVKNGVLTITLPKQEIETRKKIKVTAA